MTGRADHEDRAQRSEDRIEEARAKVDGARDADDAGRLEALDDLHSTLEEELDRPDVEDDGT